MPTLISPCRFSLSFTHFRPYGYKTRVSDLTSLLQPRTTRLGTNSMSQSSSESDAANSKNGEARGEIQPEDVLVQYVVLRRDLIDTWPMGSVVTQGCHASVSAIWENKDDPHTLQYCSPENIDFMHKVTLEVKGEAQMLNLSEKLTAAGIVHKLWIEQPENIPTCLATRPYPKSALTLFFKKLKLCK
ncbi:putative peptidyl-tRNA hydrolase PTRHD1 [Ricinus communis]|uniref:putative peptidyl-tRNA hydrolase PTRHD1 n=1 Tax=Ricinus communis TaxID=3988 RepID=UPI00201AB133|nr:putative peptidyl-tRNA hydrolase PTRHD1 [Ricinus communis]